MESRTPGQGRYAFVEREQRWVLATVPGGATAEPAAILDRYLTGTRLRLRLVRQGDDTVRKLGQKVRVEEHHPEVVKLTNLYLSEQEWNVLARLGGAEVRKTRSRIVVGGRAFAVDRFEGRHGGLVTSETELTPTETRIPLPSFALADVTDDDRFSGGGLAAATDDEIHALLQDVAALARRREGS